ncbi:MAG: TolC family protein, partial [Vibrio toranzoniae]|uniref:TolC family protein n=1 Tax=Vibrio toranzoniae TaxID=1194427 RepID=UPI003C3EF863
MQMTKPKFQYLAIASILLGTMTSPSYAAPLTFSEAWQILQDNNNSLAAQKANVERYQHLQNATGSLNLPSVTLGANYTHLDSDVTINGEQFSDSLSGVPSSLTAIGGALPGLASSLGGITSTITEQDIFSSSIRAIWPIFTGGRITAAQNAAEGKSEEAQSQLLMEKQARYEDLSKYYFSVILAEDVVRTRQAVEAGLTQHRDFA